MRFRFEVISLPWEVLDYSLECYLETVELPVNRESGVNPSTNDIKIFDSSTAWLGRRMAKGEVGCALAHQGTYERFLSGTEDFMIVLEKDASPTRILDLELLSKILSTCKPAIVMLGWNEVDAPLHLSSPVFKFRRYPPTGTFAYAMNRSAAMLAISGLQDRWGLADWPPVMAKCDFFGLNPAAFTHPIQSESQSMPGRDAELKKTSAGRRFFALLAAHYSWDSTRNRFRVSLGRDMDHMIRHWIRKWILGGRV